MLVDDLRAFARAHPDAAIICNDAADILAGQYERSAQQTSLLENQAKALSEAELVCASVKQQNGQLRELLTAADARALAAEARLAEAMRVIEPIADGSIDIGGTAIIIGSDARAIIQAARAFTNAAKEKT